MKAFLSPNQKALGRMWPFFTQPQGGRLDESFVFSIDWKNNIVSSSSEPQAFALFSKNFFAGFSHSRESKADFSPFTLFLFRQPQHSHKTHLAFVWIFATSAPSQAGAPGLRQILTVEQDFYEVNFLTSLKMIKEFTVEISKENADIWTA